MTEEDIQSMNDERAQKKKRQKKINSKLGKVRNFPPNEYELGEIELFSPKFITNILRDEH